ncbi:MAG: hypothetical protein R3E79_23005 [Caldilineaceae bacterium]
MVKNALPMLRHQPLAVGRQNRRRHAPLLTLPAWLRRYLLAELVGLVVALGNITLAGRLTDNAFLLVAVSVYGGAVGYYSALFLSLFYAVRRAKQRAGGVALPYSRWRQICTLLMTLGSAELVDSLLLSPLLLYLALHLLPNPQLAVVVSEVVSTLAFYGTVSLARRVDAGRILYVQKGATRSCLSKNI